MPITRLFRFSQRTKYFVVIAVTLLPIVSLMLIVFLTSYRPVFTCLETIVNIGHNEVQPLQKLHIALLSSTMPPHDFLIHGAVQEKKNWTTLKHNVNQAFGTVLQKKQLSPKHRLLQSMEQQWQRLSFQGDILFAAGNATLKNYDAADAMEEFDAGVNQIVHRIRELIAGHEQEINRYYTQINGLKYRGEILTLTAVLIGLVMGIMGSVWLTRERQKMVNRSLYDPLTGILNRRGIENELAQLQKYRFGDSDPAFSILLMDLDRFKNINDRYGHDVGDIALKTLATLTSKTIRAGDVFGRYGGEEFLVLLPGTELEEARIMAERIRQAMASSPVALADQKGQGQPLRLTVSIGVSTFPGKSGRVDEALKAADEAMYMAKKAGRNRVMCT